MWVGVCVWQVKMKCSNELGEEEEEEEEEMKIDDGEKSESAKECTEQERKK